MNILLSLAVSLVPILALGFVGVLIIVKLYIKIRTKFNKNVNCWFCNQNSKVPYLESNSWTCPHCEQYNGFTKDGDYNRDLIQQRDCSYLSNGFHSNAWNTSSGILSRSHIHSVTASNGFCDACNEGQRLKVEKLAQFEPKRESRFDEELKVFKANLEVQYRLCKTCERRLKNTLAEKKKMVLGAKFFNYVMKGSEISKRPHFNEIHYVQQQIKKRRCVRLIILLTVIHTWYLLNRLPPLTSEKFVLCFGDIIGQNLFIVYSITTALIKVASNEVATFANQFDFVVRTKLFINAISMLIMYTMGLTAAQAANFSVGTLYINMHPYIMMFCTFMHNIVDGFKFSRFTILLVFWSFITHYFEDYTNNTMLLPSLVTLALSCATKNVSSSKSLDETSQNFHKLCAEDCFSDDETISMLSQQLNGSNTNNNTNRSSRSTNSTACPSQQSPILSLMSRESTSFNRYHNNKSPLTSSSLNHLSTPLPSMSHDMQLSPNPVTFRNSCYLNDMRHKHQHNFGYVSSNGGTSVGSMSPRTALFASNLELSSRKQQAPLNTCGLNASFPNSSLATPSVQQQYESFMRAQQKSDGNYFFPPPMQTQYAESLYRQGQSQQSRSNLLMPSRFSTNSLNNANNATAAWLAGNYPSQHASNIPMTTTSVNCANENLSRTSSQSSGFESQIEQNNLRENAHHGPDISCDTAAPLPSSTSFLHPINMNGNSFQPIVPSSISCDNNTIPTSTDMWRLLSAPTPSSSNVVRDSFNLRQINEELPNYTTGDLLKKWKQSQLISL